MYDNYLNIDDKEIAIMFILLLSLFSKFVYTF